MANVTPANVQHDARLAAIDDLFKLGLSSEEIGKAMNIGLDSAQDYLRLLGFENTQSITEFNARTKPGSTYKKALRVYAQLYFLRRERGQFKKEKEKMLKGALEVYLDIPHLRGIAGGAGEIIRRETRPLATPGWSGYRLLIDRLFDKPIDLLTGEELFEKYLMKIRDMKIKKREIRMPTRETFSGEIADWALDKFRSQFFPVLNESAVKAVNAALQSLMPIQKKILQLRFRLGCPGLTETGSEAWSYEKCAAVLGENLNDVVEIEKGSLRDLRYGNWNKQLAFWATPVQESAGWWFRTLEAPAEEGASALDLEVKSASFKISTTLCLEKMRIRTIRELVPISEKELSRRKVNGSVRKDIKQILKSFGLSLGMRLE